MTFDDLINCCEDNKYNFKYLIKCLNANSIIPVFKSDISSNLYPTWKKLITKIADEQGIKEDINDFLNSDKFEHDTEYIYNYRGGNTNSEFYRELEKIFNPEDSNLTKLPKEVIKELVDLVSYHILFIEFLAKTTNSSEYTLLEILKRKGFEYPKLYTDHAQQDKTIAEHLSKLFSFEEISQGCQTILKHFMIMPSIEIPKEVYKWIGCDINNLVYLIKSGWINETENGYIMSNIIKLSLQLQLKDKEVKWEDYKQILSYISSDEYIKDDDDFTTVIPKLQIANSFIEKFSNEETEQMAMLLNNIGFIYANQGNYKEALKFFQKALEISKKILEENHPDIAISYNNIGFIYDSQGNYKEALNFYQKALEIRKKVLREYHPDIATSYNNIGEVHASQGDYEKALKFFQKALEIRKKVLGKNHPDTIAIYNNLESFDF